MNHHKFEDIALRTHALGLQSAAASLRDLSLEQVSKLEQVSDILEALPPVTVDDELDTVLEALIEMRDRNG
tara:strand:- start:242 stop:454 length:213 start_codon:yes stop_codon:yes gene_type:complete